MWGLSTGELHRKIQHSPSLEQMPQLRDKENPVAGMDFAMRDEGTDQAAAFHGGKSLETSLPLFTLG